ncbi:hypothetical protein Pmar_PMAR003114 [Perkinsus marinus ATCC 50983]|uniref:Uncharacterized protein n=1 Tax=Perkinsus marinus (strain ATCC 50983 / TXsc) TaxID=423536 RepID=C5L2X9_PERM5|nr:hypothetical protein Pmar_PMAR003114 [Perkinsus marinus ATCC 50983]EER08866.1 hypothetical protein Pmar_PMAR003114 [Perkinsus marinus ATCC 50983]|eukprot:XP_002777050.1 hypothetical protein Pmar_PMAR003114 [Perkinsus marinus ATCC 50983]
MKSFATITAIACFGVVGGITSNEAHVDDILSTVLATGVPEMNSIISAKLPKAVVFNPPVGIARSKHSGFLHIGEGYNVSLLQLNNVDSLKVDLLKPSVTSTNESLTLGMDISAKFTEAPRVFGYVDAYYGKLSAEGDVQVSIDEIAMNSRIDVTLSLVDNSGIMVTAHIEALKMDPINVENLDIYWGLDGHEVPHWLDDVFNDLLDLNVDLAESIGRCIEKELVRKLTAEGVVVGNEELSHFAPLIFPMLFDKINAFLQA